MKTSVVCSGRKWLLTGLAVVSSYFAAAAAEPAAAEPRPEGINDPLRPVEAKAPEAMHLAAARTFQGIPGIVVTPKGRLFATWYAGGGGECRENFALLTPFITQTEPESSDIPDRVKSPY